MEQILITGVNGFIGSHVAELFCSKGFNIGGLVRKSSNLNNINHLDLKIHYCDIREESKLAKILKGYDCVIHIAALANDWGKYKDFYDINVNGTLNILKACVANNINFVILTNSCSIYGEKDSKIIKDEKAPLNSHYPYFLDKIFPCKMNYYRDTKRIAKEKALKFAKENNLNITFIEPVWVFGEREFNTGFYEYLKTATKKIPFLPGSKKNSFHVIYVKDLARAYLLAFQKKLKGIHSFLIGNKIVCKLNSIYEMFCKETGLEKPKNMPKWIIYPIGFFLELLYTIINFKNPPLLTRGRVNMFYDNIEYSTKKAEKILGFKNEYDLKKSIKNTVNWYKKNNYI